MVQEPRGDTVEGCEAASGGSIAESGIISASSPLRILLEGHYRDLTEGTGIATYSRVTYDAIKAIGHQPLWLFGRENKSSSDAIESEVTFFDPPRSGVRILRGVNAARRLWRGITKTRSVADRIELHRVVSSAIPSQCKMPGFNVPSLYRTAQFGHELWGRIHEVRLPDPIDIFHLTAPMPIRVRGARTVLTIADLIPLRLPNATPDNKSRYLSLLRDSIAEASLIVTISETSKKDIVDILGVPPEKVVVTYLASDIEPLTAEETDNLPHALERMGLRKEGYLLFVSAIEPKKNLRRLIDAYLEIDTDLPLVIAGRKAWMWQQEIGHLDTTVGTFAKSRLRFLGYVAGRDLRYLYAGAYASCFPSLYEGFGLPALEAMTMGCPVLISGIPSLREVCGDAAVMADPYSIDDIRTKLRELLGDEALRRRCVTAGLKQAQVFTASKYFERLGRAYDRLS